MSVAALVSVVLQSKELVAAAEKTRREYSIPLAKGRDRTMEVKLSGGSVMWVTSAHCEPSVERRGTPTRGHPACISRWRSLGLEKRYRQVSRVALPGSLRCAPRSILQPKN